MVQIPDWLQPWPSPNDSNRKGSASVDVSNEQSNVNVPDVGAITTPTTLDDGGQEDAARYAHEEEREEEFYRNGPALAIPMTGASIGFVAGFYTAAKRAGLVFMAENAHRRPDTVQGWYFYNKTKNYKVLLGGARGGMRTALRVGGWTSAYIAVESGLHYLREGRLPGKVAEQLDLDDINTEIARPAVWNTRWLDGAVAGLTVAGGACLLYRLPVPIARRAVILGLLTGTSIGMLRQVQSRLVDARQEQLSHQ
jgi:hypothetical protein